MAETRAPAISQRMGITVISLGAEFESLDDQVLEQLRTCILGTADAADPPVVVLDLSHTKFFGSAFIEILFRAWNRLNAKPGGRFCISGLTPYCREVIEITHLDRLWTIFDNLDTAVTALAKSR